MKYLMALFVVSLALQSIGLQACAMDAEETSGHHPEMQKDHESECCDEQPDHSMDGCDIATPCSFVSIVVPVIPAGSGFNLAAPDRQFDFIDDDRYSGAAATAAAFS
jgi:hypothetical protein